MPELMHLGSAGGVPVEGAHIDGLPLPLLVYRGALDAPDPERARAAAEGKARVCGWQLAWTNTAGIAAERHCHTTTHEAVFVLHGKATVRYGAAGDTSAELWAGDVVFHPAGTFHQGAGDEDGIVTAGAYPVAAAPWDWHTTGLTPDEWARIRSLEEPPHPITGGLITEIVQTSTTTPRRTSS